MRRLNLFTHLAISKLLVLLFFGGVVHSFPDQGRWSVTLSEVLKVVEVSKSLFKDSLIYIQVVCDSEHAADVHIQWSLMESSCWERFLSYGPGILGQNYPLHDNKSKVDDTGNKISYKCNGHIVLEVERENTVTGVTERQKLGPDDPVYKIPADGMYLLALQIFEPKPANATYSARVDIKMVGSDGGYLSAADWPLLPFYGAMCLIYVIFGMAWLIVSFMQWRDLLRIQFWISGVILLGMLEKALFYAEYQGLNALGYSLRSAVLFAELVSCAKRTLARMLVVIVSLGFGIVKPRLGPMLHRVVACGMLYFLLASVECYKRVFSPKNGLSNQILLASMPLALLDSAFCWWIFSNLVQTLRTLRLRRNLVKLALYRHFSSALIFSIVASVIFMLYSLKMHRISNCRLDWKSLWIDEAYWHIQFSVLLFVIMILWRPANNNQRYAFSPLLDNPEDEDEEEDQFVNDSYGLKMRGSNTRSNSPNPKSSTSAEEDLKWVEDNIPASIIDHALPVLDSDDEIMTTKFEVSKMQ